MCTKYLEFDSTYRDRNKWPFPGEFEIPISQTGRKDMYNAVDPVSLSYPIVHWCCNNFNLSSQGPNVEGMISDTTTASCNGTYIIKSKKPNSFQKLNGYYNHATISLVQPHVTRRILSYTFLGTGYDYDTAEILLEGSFPDSVVTGTDFCINDPTDLTDVLNPLFFVPSIGISKYQGFYLYNEKLKQYRIILSFSKITNLLKLDASADPIVGWNITDNYCIRKNLPPYSATVIAPPSSFHSTRYSFYISSSITIPNFFKKYFIRILKNSAGHTIPPENECNQISEYDGRGKITVSSPFSIAPMVGQSIEILEFSYDNLNPFVYNGNIASQRECACYEIRLTNLILPNQLLNNAFGSRIAYYPYIYVELSNSQNSTGNNIIYSNNPNSTKMIFRSAVTDVNQPLNTTFINLDSNSMANIIKFKPNDSMKFSVRLSDGTIFKTVMPENYSPGIPNPLIQISACFSMKKI
jgi:hypothetical protein